MFIRLNERNRVVVLNSDHIASLVGADSVYHATTITMTTMEGDDSDTFFVTQTVDDICQIIDCVVV